MSVILRPQERQELFMQSSADIAIYGGGAGGGKTWALLLEVLRHYLNSKFGAVIFRRTSPQITAEGGMWDESGNIYPLLGAVPNISDRFWRFPSGSKAKFAHMQHEKHMFDWQGSQIPLILWDELTHFLMSQFFYMLSRNRSMCGVRPYVRGTCNPDADHWLAEFLSWWWDQDTGYPIAERAGVLRWFIRENERILWADDPRDLKTTIADDDLRPKSVTFIPASVYDNPALLAANPDYLSNLKALPLVERERLLGGNWKIKPTSGKLFNRAWVSIVGAAPSGGVTIRFWDFASTEKQLKKPDPDYTASLLLRYVNGRWYALDCTAEQIGPAQIDRTLFNTSAQDLVRCQQEGSRYLVRWEMEPAGAGVRENARLVSMLPGYDCGGIRPQGDKLTRFKPFVSQASVGNVSAVAGPWVDMWLSHLHNQPDLPKDDIMDATSGSYNASVAGGVEKAPGVYR